MISKIHIENFQSLKDVTLELGNVTAIGGASDSGKSALVRALYSLAMNRSSDSFLHKGQGPLRVVVESDGQTVELNRPKGKSAFYLINDEKFDKTGRDVVDEISKILGIKEYTVDKDVKILTSIQRQLDPQFLIQHSDTIVSKTIGHISNISIVFAAIRKSSADIISLNQKASTLEAQLKQNQIELDKLVDVQVRERIADTLKTGREKILKALALAKAAKSTAQRLSELRATIKGLEDETRVISLLDEAAKRDTEIYEKLSSHYIRMAKIAELKKQAAPLKRDTESTIPTLVKKTDELLESLTALAVVTTSRNTMEFVRAAHNRTIKEVVATEEELKKVTQEMDEAVLSSRICPLIQEDFKDGCHDKLVQLRVL